MCASAVRTYDRVVTYHTDNSSFFSLTKRFTCPRSIAVHRGRAEMLRTAYRQAQEGSPIQYDDVDLLQVTTVGTIVTFNQTACELV
jgi:3-oxoacyl-[acyl-carrier-protein] synthase III